MAVNNISTYGAHQSFLQNISVMQGSLNNSQVQISSGYVSQTFEGLNGSVEQFVSLNAQISRLQTYQQGNGVITSQLQTTNTALTQMISITNSLKALVVTQMSGTANNASYVQQVQSSADAMISQLNTTSQGSYVFGGSNTNTPPIITPLPDPVLVGVPDNSYYQGSTQNTSFRIADGQIIENTTRADNPAFQDIFAAIALATKPGVTTDDLKKAQNFIDSAVQGLIGLQANANSNILRVQQVNSQSETVRVYYKGLSEAMSKSDPVALSTKIAQDQTILQASFSAFARISSLSLSNYLK